MQVSELSYYKWVGILEKKLGIKIGFGVKEYKDTVDYNGIEYKKEDLCK